MGKADTSSAMLVAMKKQPKQPINQHQTTEAGPPPYIIGESNVVAIDDATPLCDTFSARRHQYASSDPPHMIEKAKEMVPRLVNSLLNSDL